jgi:hypothetical protein
MLQHHIRGISATILALIVGGFFIYHALFRPAPPVYGPAKPEGVATTPIPIPAKPREIVRTVLPAIQPKVATGTANVIFRSPKVFAYAHGTVQADGRIFIGMAHAGTNPFATNQVVMFGDQDIAHANFSTLPFTGDIETMVYDDKNDRIYFLLSGGAGGLHLYGLNPHTYDISTLASSTLVDVGRRPAIVTDGKYVYGITDTNPSAVFKVGVNGGELIVDQNGHIPRGHSAAIGIYATSTELYFGGGMSNGFEKTDAATLQAVAATKIEPCAMSDDVAFVKTSDTSGQLFLGCEVVPYGVKVDTADLSFERFSLPGAARGVFSYGSDLYNASQDGYIDVFPNGNLKDLRRYKVRDDFAPLETNGQDLQPNEIFYSPITNKLYLTAWLGVKGLYQVSTTSVVIAGN